MTPGLRVCMSGAPECSGIDPCDGCLSLTLTYVLVPAMKAAGFDQPHDRVVTFLRSYHRARESALASVLQSAQEQAQLALPIPPPPTVPPIADVPLTEAELEGMAQAAEAVDAMAETVPAPVATAAMPSPEILARMAQATAEVVASTPAGLLSDEEFRERFPTLVAEDLMVMPAPKPAPLPRKSEPSLLKLASQALTPKLPTAGTASDPNESGSAPSPALPSPGSESKALTDDVSAVPVSANPIAESDTKAEEATTHG